MEKIKKAQLGNDEAKSVLLCQYLPLVKSVVRRYKNKQIESDVLIQLGTLGLIKAINNFDTTSGVSFFAYARKKIEKEVTDNVI